MDRLSLTQQLDTIQVQLSMLNIPNPRVERRRDEDPNLSLTWQGKDKIWRSLVALITRENTLYLEVNAWQDIEGVRHWRQQRVKDIAQGYQLVRGWTVDELTQVGNGSPR